MKFILIYLFVLIMNAHAHEGRSDIPPAAAAAACIDGGLPNACGVMATVFLQRYLAASPAETGGFFILETPREKEGHALALFSHAGTTWIYDHEIGLACTGIPSEKFDYWADKPAIGALYHARLREALGAGGRHPGAAGAVRDSALRARLLLGPALKPAVVRIRGSEDYVCVWDFNGCVWAYSPPRGTTWIRPDGVKSFRELVGGALARFGIREPFDPVPLPPLGGGSRPG